MIKRTLSLILIFILASTVSFAEEISYPMEAATLEDGCLEETASTFLTGGSEFEIEELATIPEEVAYIPNFFSTVSLADILALYIEAYIEEMDALPKAISVSGMGITRENIVETYFAPVMKNPQLLLANLIRVNDVDEDGFIDIIELKFLVDSVEEYYSEKQKMFDGMQEYVDLALQYDDPVEQLLAVHDKMVELCVYDTRINDPDPEVRNQAPYSIYHALGVFRDKLAVCQGYSQAIYMIGQVLGIKVEFCRSDSAGHMWNYIKLDDKWYYMDMTNDDPADAQGRAAHTFFLFSENKLHPQGHGNDYRIYGEGESPVCDDTRYDSNHLFNIPVFFKGYKDENGYYNASTNYTKINEDIKGVAAFKSKSLYLGPVAVATMVTEGNYTVTENGQQVQKRDRNLYMLEYSFGNIGKTFPILKFRDSYIVMGERESMEANTIYIRGVFLKVPEDIDLTQFTSFVLGENLAPYSTKLNWR